MALNPEIPLSVRPLQLDDPLQKYAQFEQLKGMQRQFTMADEDLALRKQAQAQQDRRLDLQEQRQAAAAEQSSQSAAMTLAKNQWEMIGKLAGAVLNTAPQNRPTVWAQAVQVAREHNLPEASNLSEQWNEEMVPKLEALLTRAMTPEQAAERQDYRALGQPGSQQSAPAFVDTTTIDPESGALLRAHNLTQPVGVPIGENDMGPVEVNAKHPDNTPDSLRAQAAAQRRKGTKVAFEYAKELESEANKLDDRIWKERERDAPTELARLYRDRDKHPPGSPAYKRFDEVIAGYKAGRGDTNIEVRTGPMDLGKEPRNANQKSLIGDAARLASVFDISRKFKPEYQTIGGKLKNSWLAGRDMFGDKLTNKERRDLSDYTDFRASAGELYATTLKDMAGTAMTEGEVKIHSQYLPKPGTGIFDGDSPLQLKSKVDRLDRTLRLAIARRAYIERNGMSLTKQDGSPVISIEQMPSLMKQRAKEIQTEITKANPKISQEALRRQINSRFVSEFGIVE